MTPRDLACLSLWSDKPLVRLYQERTGQSSFSVKQLIAFAESLPATLIEKMWGESSQLPPRAGSPTRRPSQQAHRHS